MRDLIINSIIGNLPFEPNGGQRELIEKLADFMVSRQQRRCFILRGYAGTGKTSIVGALVRAMSGLNVPCALLAPTGRAAKVMSRFSGQDAYTIHKAIYRQDPRTGHFGLTENTLKRGIVIVDEASMISSLRDNPVFGTGCLLDDLVSWVYSIPRCYMVLVGDDAQLPPVGQEESRALNARYMAGYGLDIYEYILSEVARQASLSGILSNATDIRARQQGTLAQTDMRYTADFERIEPHRVSEQIERSYQEVGMEETLILTRSNIRTNLYNQGVRGRILDKEEILSAGDRIMVSRNNYYDQEKGSFLANGEMLQVKRVRNERELYGFHYIDAELLGVDQPFEINRIIWLDTLTAESPEVSYQMLQTLAERIAEDYPEIKSKSELTRLIKENPYYNALQVRYAYAVTCHKAQGGQWKHVYVDVPSQTVNGELTISDLEYNRWLYTAVTRATEKVFWVQAEEKKLEG